MQTKEEARVKRIERDVKNREKIKAQSAEYRKQNKEKIRESTILYRKNNKTRYLESVKRSRKSRCDILTSFVQSYLELNPCCDCGERLIVCLDFHHLFNKKLKISDMRRFGYSLETVKQEIEKCCVLCANCHRKRHSISTKIRRPNKKESMVKQIKEAGKCYSCGYNECVMALEFHHTKDKIAAICTMQHRKEYTLSDILEEIKKCVILCANCHRKLHSTNIPRSI